LRPIILLLDSTPCPALTGLVDASGAEKVPNGAALAAADSDEDEEAAAAEAAGGGGSKAEERQLLLAQTLVGELVLATKEVCRKLVSLSAAGCMSVQSCGTHGVASCCVNSRNSWTCSTKHLHQGL
jgi:hypothetical protein